MVHEYGNSHIRILQEYDLITSLYHSSDMFLMAWQCYFNGINILFYLFLISLDSIIFCFIFILVKV